MRHTVAAETRSLQMNVIQPSRSIYRYLHDRNVMIYIQKLIKVMSQWQNLAKRKRGTGMALGELLYFKHCDLVLGVSQY